MIDMTVLNHQIVSLQRMQIASAAAVAARAFADDPMFTYIFPSAAQRPAQLRRFMTAALRYGVLFGEGYTTDDGAGTALWLTPEQPEITPARMLRSGMAALPFTIGLKAFQRFLGFASYGDEVHGQHVREPHWYLLNLAVEPARQRQGIGSRLIAPVLARAERAGEPCYLETNNPDNLPFYARHGFAVVHEGQVPNGGPAFWGMLRPAQSRPGTTSSLRSLP